MGKKVLLVEDNPANQEIVSVILESMDYDVIIANEGGIAITMAQENKPDIILMDLHLTGMDGIEATRFIKQDSELSDIPIIAVTADIYAKREFLAAGGDAYMTKPIRSGALLRTIQQVLSSKQE